MENYMDDAEFDKQVAELERMILNGQIKIYTKKKGSKSKLNPISQEDLVKLQSQSNLK
jgi:Tfp pilus assembly protein PilO